MVTGLHSIGTQPVERITVIAGTFHFGMGETFDQAKTKAFPAGSFVYISPNMPPFAWAEGETVIQLTGEGPWGVTYVNPMDDPRQAKKSEKSLAAGAGVVPHEHVVTITTALRYYSARDGPPVASAAPMAALPGETTEGPEHSCHQSKSVDGPRPVPPLTTSWLDLMIRSL